MAEPQQGTAAAAAALPTTTTTTTNGATDSATSASAAPAPASVKVDAPANEQRDSESKSKRRFFGLGKKREEAGKMGPPPAPLPTGTQQQSSTTVPASRDTATTKTPSATPTSTSARPLSPAAAPTGDMMSRQQQQQHSKVPISPTRQHHPYPSVVAASPSPSRLRSSSPRVHSPASSEIFERSVQEPVGIAVLQSGGPGEAGDAPAHIPAHMITEDHIPPALEASAQAITSGYLNPDDVEIVTSVAHQPAAISVLEASVSHADLGLNSPLSPLHKVRSDDSGATDPSISSPPPPQSSLGGLNDDDGTSTYGSLDPTDVRRLSFISFADIVQSEHLPQLPPTSAGFSDLGGAGSRDSLHIANIPSSLRETAASAAADKRASSPLRSPRSPRSPIAVAATSAGGVTTPPLQTSAVAQFHAEPSPVRSTASGALMQHGELTIETMSQAVRKTASGDLRSGGAGLAGSTLGSPISGSLLSDDALGGRSGRTNT